MLESVASNPEERYNIAKSQNNPVNISQFVEKHSGDPAVEVSSLRSVTTLFVVTSNHVCRVLFGSLGYTCCLVFWTSYHRRGHCVMRRFWSMTVKHLQRAPPVTTTSSSSNPTACINISYSGSTIRRTMFAATKMSSTLGHRVATSWCLPIMATTTLTQVTPSGTHGSSGYTT